MSYEIRDNKLILSEAPKRTKKITATRFATVMGLNPYKTEFETWCEITRTYEKPFEDSIYTIAGKAIEPKVIQYLKDVYFMDIKAPAEIYGDDYFNKTKGDFFPENKIFGGMWDVVGEDVVVEIKTTKNSTDWLQGIPVYYKLQAALYAWLCHIDEVCMVCSFLEDKDYTNPSAFVPTSKNTIVRTFLMSEDYPNFYEDYVAPAEAWWAKYVESGASPAFDEKFMKKIIRKYFFVLISISFILLTVACDEKKDADALKTLRTSVVEADDASIEILMKSIQEHQAQLDAIAAESKPIEAELKKEKEALKKFLQGKMTEKDTKAEIKGDSYKFVLSKTIKTDVDKKALEADGLLEKYNTTKTEYRLTVAKK